MIKVTDEMLMSLADGELGPETAASVLRAVEADPALGARLAAFRDTRALAAQAFAHVLDEPVPQRVAAAARSAAGPTRRHVGRVWLPAGAAIAASIAGFLLAVLLLDGGPAGLLTGEPEIARLMQTSPSGTVQSWRGTVAGQGTFQATATYEVPGGICRTFTATAGAEAWRGVACRRDDGWQVEMAVTDRTGGPVFAPASDRATQAIDAFLDATAAGPVLDATAEARLLNR